MDMHLTDGWLEVGDTKLGPRYRRPLTAIGSEPIRQLYAWYLEKRDSEGYLDRSLVQPSKLGKLINYVSLFDIIKENGEIVDFYIRVLSFTATQVFGEHSRKNGAALLPKPVFDRWVKIYRHCLEEKAPVLVQGKILHQGTYRRCAETLAIPVKKGGEFCQIMILNEYFSQGWEEFDQVPVEECVPF